METERAGAICAVVVLLLAPLGARQARPVWSSFHDGRRPAALLSGAAAGVVTEATVAEAPRFSAAVAGAALSVAPAGRAAPKRIVLVAGPLSPSHGPREHEHNAGVLLLRKCLQGIPAVTADAHLNGWPKDPQAFDGADAIVIYANEIGRASCRERV